MSSDSKKSHDLKNVDTTKKTKENVRDTEEYISASAKEVYAIGKESSQFESPINLTFQIMRQINLPKLKWTNENEPPKLMKLTNSGESVIMSAKWFGPRPYLSQGPLLGNYLFSQMHFHWGSIEYGGSEHTFNNTRKPLEMHIMFFKSEYLCQEEAMKKNDGVLIIAFIAELQEEDSEALKPITENLCKIGNAKTSESIELLPLSHFFKPFVDDYYMYWGNIINIQSILWIISRRPLAISANQINCFRYIRNLNREIVKSNYRTTKPLQDRVVFYVNPDSIYEDHLIMPLDKVINSTTDKHDKKIKDEKKKVGFDLENEVCNKPTIDISDIEDKHNLNILFDRFNEKKLIKKEDSLVGLTEIKELKQRPDETYNNYLDRINKCLKNILAQVETKKKKNKLDDSDKVWECSKEAVGHVRPERSVLIQRCTNSFTKPLTVDGVKKSVTSNISVSNSFSKQKIIKPPVRPQRAVLKDNKLKDNKLKDNKLKDNKLKDNKSKDNTSVKKLAPEVIESIIANKQEKKLATKAKIPQKKKLLPFVYESALSTIDSSINTIINNNKSNKNISFVDVVNDEEIINKENEEQDMNDKQSHTININTKTSKKLSVELSKNRLSESPNKKTSSDGDLMEKQNELIPVSKEKSQDSEILNELNRKDTDDKEKSNNVKQELIKNKPSVGEEVKDKKNKQKGGSIERPKPKFLSKYLVIKKAQNGLSKHKIFNSNKKSSERIVQFSENMKSKKSSSGSIKSLKSKRPSVNSMRDKRVPKKKEIITNRQPKLKSTTVTKVFLKTQRSIPTEIAVAKQPKQPPRLDSKNRPVWQY